MKVSGNWTIVCEGVCVMGLFVCMLVSRVLVVLLVVGVFDFVCFCLTCQSVLTHALVQMGIHFTPSGINSMPNHTIKGSARVEVVKYIVL